MKKSPSEVKVGDTVIAHRGIYSGMQCRVKGIEATPYGNFNMKVVPTIPVAGHFTVDRTEVVEVLNGGD
jgi:hypothetical protein